MTNDDKTQQPTNSDNLVLAAIRSLEARIGGVEEVILARLNNTRPLDQQLLAKINELVDKQTAMQQDFAAMRQEQTAMQQDFAAMRQEQAAIREALEGFRDQTHENFRKMIQRQELLNNDNFDSRFEHRQLEKRVSRLEEKAA